MSTNETTAFISTMFDLSGTKAVVTGGAGVIPRAMAKALVSAGAMVCLWGRGTGHPVAEAVDELGADTGAPERLCGVTVDTGDEAAVNAAYDQTVCLMGTPNLLVNGVGGNKGKGPFVDIDVALFSDVLSLNLVAGLVVPTKVFAKRWIAGAVRDASIINLASMSSYIPLSGVWAYDAAKSAVLNLTVGTAKEFAPHGIRVNGIAPGFFIGNQNKALLIKNEQTGELTERGQAVINHTPFARFGSYDDLVGSTLFLASTRASGFITGVTIPIDGGYLTYNV